MCLNVTRVHLVWLFFLFFPSAHYFLISTHFQVLLLVFIRTQYMATSLLYFLKWLIYDCYYSEWDCNTISVEQTSVCFHPQRINSWVSNKYILQNSLLVMDDNSETISPASLTCVEFFSSAPWRFIRKTCSGHRAPRRSPFLSQPANHYMPIMDHCLKNCHGRTCLSSFVWDVQDVIVTPFDVYMEQHIWIYFTVFELK